MPNKPEKPEVVTHILGLFHLDKLCPKCQGPIEINNTVSCNACDLKLHLKVHIDFIETGCMNIRYCSGLGRKPILNQRQQQLQQAESKPKKKPAPKKRKTTPKKKATPKKRKKQK